MPIPRVLVAGGVNLDTTYRVRAIPAVGETIGATGVSQAIGGKGLNQALAVRRAGTQVGIIGAVGLDSAGREIRDFLDAEDISSSLLKDLPGIDTGRAVIFVDDNADNAIVVNPGANAMTDDEIIPRANDGWQAVRAVVANGEAPMAVVKRLFSEARKRGITTVWNPSPMPADIVPIIRLTDMLIVNETEAAELAGTDDSSKDHIERLAQMGPSEIVITRGREGCLVAHDDQIEQIPTPRVDAVDPTAAGDTFLGYYVASRTNGLSPAGSAALASEAAALCVQVHGASNSIPFRSALKVADEMANQ